MNHTPRVTLLLLAFLFIVPACQAQLPNTPAANQAKAWLDVFNAGDVVSDRFAIFAKDFGLRLLDQVATAPCTDPIQV